VKLLNALGASVLALIFTPLLAADYVAVSGGRFRSALAENDGPVTVAPYTLRTTAVTRAEFRAFLDARPEWQRDRVSSLLAGPAYLAGWSSQTAAADALPMTGVSWFAARAYCELENARLPTWYEWEFAAAADASHIDARADPAWREQILQWYEHPASSMPSRVGLHPNVWGVSDLHGSIYEWVEDFNGLFVTTDSRSQGEQKTLATCGSAALSLDDRENYAILMRVAMLASLTARDAPSSIGFRCARNARENAP
jgi:formylglycine-generating enzyme required for sulfatase activity